MAEYATCAECGGRIIYAPTAGSGFDRPVWTHRYPSDWESHPHQAIPDARSE